MTASAQYLQSNPFMNMSFIHWFQTTNLSHLAAKKFSNFCRMRKAPPFDEAKLVGWRNANFRIQLYNSRTVAHSAVTHGFRKPLKRIRILQCK